MSLGRSSGFEYPRQLGRYTLVSRVGEGGNATVHKGILNGPFGFAKEVAVKQLKHQFLDASEAMQHFVKEARIGGLLRHPNLVEIYEIEEVDNERFIVMEYVDGLPLNQVLKQSGAIPAPIVLQMGIQLCQALQSAHTLTVKGHQTSVVHCDLKPANILVDRFGTVKILDFGIARWVGGDQMGDVRGTPAYMAPEQIIQKPLDGRTDLFSLAAILYELLTGKRLFRGKVRELLRLRLRVDEVLHHDEIWQPIEASCKGLGPVLWRCLRRDPNQRYESAQALCEVLREQLSTFTHVESLMSWNARFQPEEERDMETVRLEDGEQTVAKDSQTRTVVETAAMPLRQDVFVGRETVLAALLDCLKPGEIVTLVGLGGMGKTRMALEASSKLGRTEFSEVVFCDLVDVRSEMGLLTAISKPLGLMLKSRATEPLRHELLGAMMERIPTLFIVDNAEQVVDEVRTLFLSTPFHASPHCILFTSRVPIDLDREVIVRLDGLSVEEGVELFRARSATKLTENEPGLKQFVKQLDGMPLAIELAARRTADNSVQEMVSLLNTRFELLATDQVEDTPRHSALSIVLDSTWSGLSDWERDTLAQCSAFRGGFFIEDAEAVIDLSQHDHAPWAVDALQNLVDKCLLVPVPSQGGQRLMLLFSVAAYAEARIAEFPEREILELYRRHASRGHRRT